MKRILMVGAGSCQINAIKKIKELGHLVVAADYNDWTEGKGLADVSVRADAFSEQEILDCAREYAVDGIMTVGTDQPVLTVTKAAEVLNLPRFLDSGTALLVTNKKEMKKRFQAEGIPTAGFALVAKGFQDETLRGLTPPFVVKPVDSQGQRGIFKLQDIQAVRESFDDVVRHSRCEEILVEEYYENQEITVSGWVSSGIVSIFTVTDRVTFSSDEHIGVCTAHNHPSIHLPNHREEIFQLTEKICNVFGIKEGPIYFQYLVGDRGILVNEIACRLGGAYEDVTIPFVTGIDVLRLNVEGCLGRTDGRSRTEAYTYREDVFFTTQLFFCEPGEVAYVTPMEEMRELPFVVGAGYNVKTGDRLIPIENASQRAGYLIVSGKDQESLQKNLEVAASILRIEDAQGKNLVLPFLHGPDYPSERL